MKNEELTRQSKAESCLIGRAVVPRRPLFSLFENIGAKEHLCLTGFRIRLTVFVCVFCVFCGEFVSGQVITASLTITNTPTNGNWMQINGTQRNFTNIVTAANTQIATNGTIMGTTSNVFLAYAQYPQPNTQLYWVLTTNYPCAQATNVYTNIIGGVTNTVTNIVSQCGTNKILFTSFPGQPMAISFNITNWASVTYSTNIYTNNTVVRVPRSVTGNYERTNVESGLVDWLNDSKMTNSIDALAPAWTNFTALLVLQTMGTNITNYIVICSNISLTIGTNATNFTLAKSLVCSNLAYAIGLAGTNNVLVQSNWDFGHYLSSALLQYYIDGSGNISATNGNGAVRLSADQADDVLGLKFLDGNNILGVDNNENVTMTEQTGSSVRFEMDAYNQDLSGEGVGATVLRNHNGSRVVLKGTSGQVYATQPVSAYTNWLGTLMGTTTNFTTIASNFDNSEDALNNFNVPANTFTNLGDTLHEDIALTFVGGGSSEVKVYLFGDTIFDTGSITVPTGKTMGITVTAFATTLGGSGQLAYTVNAIWPGMATNYANIAGVDFTSPGACKKGVIGASASKVGIILDHVEFKPSSVWGTLP